LIRLIDIAGIVFLFIIVSLLLSIFGIFPVTLMNILSYSLLTIGISLVFSEAANQKKILIFFGSVIFLSGVLLLISENFYVNISAGKQLPVFLIFCGSGLLVIQIVTSSIRILLLISVVLLSAGLALLLFDSSWSFKSFINAVLPVVNFLWPVVLIILVLVFMLKLK
jgi:hypothetical protein